MMVRLRLRDVLLTVLLLGLPGRWDAGAGLDDWVGSRSWLQRSLFWPKNHKRPTGVALHTS